MNFSEILQQIGENERQVITIPAGWTQGRALFGGLTAGIAYQHGMLGVSTQQPLRAMTLSFVAPLAEGELELQRVILREGKNVTQVRVDLLQNNEIGLSALLTFGASRVSKVNVTDTPKRTIPTYEGVPDFPKTPFYRLNSRIIISYYAVYCGSAMPILVGKGCNVNLAVGMPLTSQRVREPHSIIAVIF